MDTAAAAASTISPAKKSRPPAGPPTVAVDQTTNLYNQTVKVSWTNFKPSSDSVVHAGTTMYVVRVYQCRGTAPTSWSDCYGSKDYTYPGKQPGSTIVLPDGPANYVDATTAADGTGSVQLEVRTAFESSSLGCDSTHSCSIVVVPNNGDPANKKMDSIFATNAYMDSTWAWANHITVPITYAPTGATCPLGTPSVTTVGSPMLQRAVMSWQPAVCQGSSAVGIDYTGLGEPEGRATFMQGRADIALTTLPQAPASTEAHAFSYAPLAVSGITVAFHVDDSVTGQPIPDMKLTPRLVAKLLTESYGGTGYVAPGQPVGSGNPATAGNPYSLWRDPEFLALNPGHNWPVTWTNPLVVAGNTDLVWELTRWIEADPEARAWLAGTADQWGMHVNTDFKNYGYPVSSIELRDPYPALSYTFVPIDGLNLVARSLVANQPPSSSPTPDASGLHPKDPQQLPGSRQLIAIVDTADAAAFSFPEAQLRNTAGQFVGPTPDALAAAEKDMTVNPDGQTRAANFTVKDAAAYPLTVIDYAMVPTSGTAATKVRQLVDMLTYVTGSGQTTGLTPGDLPPGYLPVPADLKAADTAAIDAVQKQSGRIPSVGGVPVPSSQPPASTPPTSAPVAAPAVAGSGPIASPPLAPAATPSAPQTVKPSTTLTHRQSLVAATIQYRPQSRSLGAIRWVFPLLLLVAGLAAIAGPAVLFSATTGRSLAEPFQTAMARVRRLRRSGREKRP
jgi:hypothetical protein